MKQNYNLNEQFTFSTSIKKTIYIIGIIGLIFFGIGLLIANFSSDKHHSDIGSQEELLLSQTGSHLNTQESHHHGSSLLVKRIGTNLWINSVFFTGLAITAFFFFTIQYVAMSGWSVLLVRVPMAFGSYLPIAFIFMLTFFGFFYYDIFHWTHDVLQP